MIKKLLLFLICFVMIFFSKAQNKQISINNIPSIKESYKNYSVFYYVNGENDLTYGLTKPVSTPTFIEITVNKKKIILPYGYDDEKRYCDIEIDNCSAYYHNNRISYISLPVECVNPDGYTYKSEVRIHYVYSNKGVTYLYSIPAGEGNDRWFYHNYSEEVLKGLLDKNAIPMHW